MYTVIELNQPALTSVLLFDTVKVGTDLCSVVMTVLGDISQNKVVLCIFNIGYLMQLPSSVIWGLLDGLLQFLWPHLLLLLYTRYEDDFFSSNLTKTLCCASCSASVASSPPSSFKGSKRLRLPLSTRLHPKRTLWLLSSSVHSVPAYSETKIVLFHVVGHMELL